MDFVDVTSQQYP